MRRQRPPMRRVHSSSSVHTDIVQGTPSFPRTPHIFVDAAASPSAADPSFRQQLAFYLDTTRTGRTWELIDAVLSLVQCCLYLWNTTYVSTDHQGATPLPALNVCLEMSLAALILLQYLPKLCLAPDVSHFVFSNYSLLTLISTLPVLASCILSLSHESVYKSYMSAGNLVYVYPIRWQRLSTVIGITLVPIKDPIFKMSPVTRKAIDVSCAVLFTIVTASAFIHITTYKRQKNSDSTFYDVFYFTVMSSTSGLSTNIAADNWFTRGLLLYLMIAGAFYIPTHLSELLSMIRSRSKYSTPYDADTHHNHVLVCGNFEVTSMLEFLREFFCSDHGLATINTHVVILNPNEPSEELSTILNDPAYSSRVKYVIGSATSFRALNKVSARSAEACFILTSKFNNQDTDVEEAELVMRALAIKKFDPNLPVYLEFISPESQSHFDYLANQTLCMDELKLGILSQSCRLPGFATMVSLLSTSVTDESTQYLTQMTEDNDMAFLKPYLRGASQEIYSARLSPEFAGLTFLKVAELIYLAYNTCLIGLGLQIPSEFLDQLPSSYHLHVVLNPAEYILVGNEIGFVISTEVGTAACIERFHIVQPMPEETEYHANTVANAAEASITMNDDTNRESEPLLGNTLKGQRQVSTLSTDKPYRESPTVLNSISKHLRILKRAGSNSEVSDPDQGVISNDKDKEKEKNITLTMNETEDTSGATSSPQSQPDDTHLRHSLILPSLRQSEESTGPASVIKVKQKVKLMRKVESADDLPDYLPPSAALEDSLPNNITKHILVCDASTTFPRNLELFLSTLRGPHLTTMSPVVILCPSEPSVQDRRKYAPWENVHYVTGSPLQRRDLMRAGIERVSRVVVLSSARTTNRTADASVILTVLNIESLAQESVFVVVEFVHKENMKYIGNIESLTGLNDGFSQTILRPSFMSGHVFSQSLLDSLLAQSYYNEDLMAVLKRLIFPEKRTILELAIAEGQRIADKQRTRKAFQAMIGHHKNTQENPTIISQTTHLFQCSIGQQFLDSNYGELYVHLLQKHQAVTLGLYRIANSNGVMQLFTIINPQLELPLKKGDKAFVLSKEKPDLS